MRTNPITASTRPNPRPARNSRRMTRHQSRSFTSPSAIARMTRVVACEPEFPPLEMISGMNSASTTARAISFSKKPIALAVSISPRNSADSQPTRLRVICGRPRQLRVRDPGAGSDLRALRVPRDRPRRRAIRSDVLLRALRRRERRLRPPRSRLARPERSEGNPKSNLEEDPVRLLDALLDAHQKLHRLAPVD